MLSLDERRNTVITTQTSGREVHQCTRLPCLAYCMVQSPVIGLCGHDYFKIFSAGWGVIFPVCTVIACLRRTGMELGAIADTLPLHSRTYIISRPKHMYGPSLIKVQIIWSILHPCRLLRSPLQTDLD